ncbi:MAG: 50S ribosomal protein L9 [Deltaproteobacteria bacterium RIFOXYA12_FULL_61_11]|nr:MAG: 50S ribosomal protein L9 [Deltaproteobacteria bacterium RIFOXYA12_FULL_61_11]
MKVMLTENVKGLGKVGDVLNVARGYARNFLFPTNIALEAREGSVRNQRHTSMLMEHKRKKDLKNAQVMADKIASMSCTIAKKAGENEKLFGSVTAMDIEKQLLTEGIEVDRGWIQLDEPIKKLGIYSVPIRITADVTTKIKVWVVEE